MTSYKDKRFLPQRPFMDREAVKPLPEKQAYEAFIAPWDDQPSRTFPYYLKTNDTMEQVKKNLNTWFGKVLELKKIDSIPGYFSYIDYDSLKNKC